MFLLVLGLCILSCLPRSTIGYSSANYVPLSPLSHTYSPYHKLLNPYAYSAVYSHTNSIHGVPVPALNLKSQYYITDVHGQSSYGHSEPLQSHHATQDVHGNKAGTFSYVKPDGQIHRTDYIADAVGYRVVSNDLPVGPALNTFASSHIETPIHTISKRSIYSSATPIVTPNGYLADTPEVAAAKAAHFAEHIKRGNHYAAPYAIPSYYSEAHYNPYSHIPAVTPDGYLADTPEVSAAKAAHFAEKAKISSHHNAIPLTHNLVNPYVNIAALAATYSPQSSYYANPIVLPNGHLADTPEVAQAKAAHLAEHALVANRQKRNILLGETPANTVALASPILGIHTNPVIPPYSYSLISTYPYSHSLNNIAVVHGPHAVSFTHRQ